MARAGQNRLVNSDRAAFGYTLVVIGALLFVVNAGVSRVVMRSGIDPTALTTVRITGAAIVFGLWAAATRPQLLKPPRGWALWNIAMLGLIGVASLQLSYNIAIDRLPVGIALLLEYLAPVMVIVWVRFVRREPVRQRMWVAVACAVVGIGVVSRLWDGLAFDTLGVLMGLVAAVSFATYFLLGERNVADFDPLHVIFWAFLTAALLMNVVWPPWGQSGWFETTSMLGSLEHLSLPVWLLVVWVAVLGTGAPFFCHLFALRFIPPTVVTIVAMLEPVGANILGWAWFGETLTAVQLLGVALVLTGIALAQTARVRRPPEVPPST